ncbi:uncharacterized protein LOC141967594 [Athene noctua]|uniref:uncharacterized protein LOC141967594 n=1 Tax=Athene noctua TaxID=126797 RepID=UPI003EB6D4BA
MLGATAGLLGVMPPVDLICLTTFSPEVSQTAAQKKAVGHILDDGYSALDSSKANQSFSKVDKPLTKEQKEEVSKKGNKKAKQTSDKSPRCRSEGRSKQKSSSINVKESKDVSPSTSLTLSSNNTAVITKTTTRTLPLKQKMQFVNVKAQHLQNTNKQSKSIKDLEIQLLQVECEDLKHQLGCLREGLMGQKPGDTEELLKQSQKELLWLQRQLSFISTGGPVCVLAASKENELKDAVQEKNRLSLQYASVSHKALQYDQVKADYDHLRETLLRVTKERDLAVKGKHQLQAKLENLEQVLKTAKEPLIFHLLKPKVFLFQTTEVASKGGMDVLEKVDLLSDVRVMLLGPLEIVQKGKYRFTCLESSYLPHIKDSDSKAKRIATTYTNHGNVIIVEISPEGRC